MILTQDATPLPTGSEALFADVIVPRHLVGPFTYLVPLSLRPSLRIGHWVLVPFGRAILQGAVIAIFPVLPHGLDRTRLKEIRSLLPEGAVTNVSPNLFRLSQQVAEQYVAPWGQCLRLVLPPRSKPRAKVSRYELTEQGRAALVAREPSSVKARALLTRLGKKPSGLRRSSRSPDLADLVQDFKARGWVREVQDLASAMTAPFARPSRQGKQDSFRSIIPLFPDVPQSWSEPLFEVLRGQRPTRVMVQAPWTDRLGLLQRAVRLVLDRGQTVLIIIGEAERAQWVAGLICDEEAGIAPVCFHSGLSAQVKAKVWEQTQQQIIRVVVGTRSAIFLPLTNIGAIWIEGEEDSALKEPQEPRYHARDVAWLRAQNEQIVLVLSSPHPSLETRAAAEQAGTVIRKLISSNARPNIEVVELHHHGSGSTLSQMLIRAIRETIGRRAGVLLFLNRKGYAGALVCCDCGQVPRCSACCVALVYSRQVDGLRCSYCGDIRPLPETCVSCSGPRMRLIGEGTERLEEDAKRLFLHAKVIRLDGDTMRSPAQAEALWRRVEQREWDIIVGTQLLLRRGPLPMMGLVGIVQADAGLNVPDFRSAERTYHTLLDVVSLADPAGVGGQVIMQANLSSHHALQAVVQNDESIFFSEELSHRAVLGYPPAVCLIALLVSGTDEKMVCDAAMAWVARLTVWASQSVAGETVPVKTPSTVQSNTRVDRLTVLGPVPSSVPKLRGRYRWQILVKSSKREAGLEAVRITVKEMERTHQRRAIKFDVDVDPIEMS